VSGDELLDIAGEAARAAGEVLVASFGLTVAISTKSTATDLVSEVDIAAEEAIRAVLARRAPDDAIVGEEGEDVRGTSGRRWVVDPLDGTINYLFGVPQWCVSVACEGRAGVIFDPVRDELFAAVAGGPATLNGAPAQAREPGALSDALVATGFGYDAAQRARQGALAARVLPSVRDIRRFGSAALDLAWLAAGRYDAYYEHGVKPWDTAAGEVVCAAAGLELHPLRARDGLPVGLLAAPRELAAPLLALVDQD
jgi:myo-inositol-1(or 4)-monophosphatase